MTLRHWGHEKSNYESCSAVTMCNSRSLQLHASSARETKEPTSVLLVHHLNSTAARRAIASNDGSAPTAVGTRAFKWFSEQYNGPASTKVVVRGPYSNCSKYKF
eukprot:2767297-Rhodomonas_salina.1